MLALDAERSSARIHNACACACWECWTTHIASHVQHCHSASVGPPHISNARRPYASWLDAPVVTMRRIQVWTSSPWLGPGSAPFTASFAHVGALKGARLCTRGWSVAHVRETFRPSSERMAAVRVTTRLEPVLASGMGGLAHPRSRSDPTAPDGAPRVPGGRAGAWVARWRPGAMTRSQAQLERHDLRSGRGGGGESRDRAHSAG